MDVWASWYTIKDPIIHGPSDVQLVCVCGGGGGGGGGLLCDVMCFGKEPWKKSKEAAAHS